MAVTPVGARDVIVLPQCFTHADGNRFLADVEVGESGHFGAEVELIDLLFEQTDLEHLAVEVKPALVADKSSASVFLVCSVWIEPWSKIASPKDWSESWIPACAGMTTDEHPLFSRFFDTDNAASRRSNAPLLQHSSRYARQLGENLE